MGCKRGYRYLYLFTSSFQYTGFGQVKSALPGECSNQNPQPKAKKGTRGVRRGRRGRKNKPIPPPPKLKSGKGSNVKNVDCFVVLRPVCV